ncbi:MAG: DUF6291 domain-containing protein [Lachnospiraceae bacterium]|nr:DUF6291 domain-containing protein [Lachnospiraceae bacterium]
MRDSIVFYKSFYEAVRNLPPEDFKKAVSAILEYGLNNIVPEESDGIAHTVFTLTKPQIDANNRRYENGFKGGKKPKCYQSDTKPIPNRNQTVTKPLPNVNVNVNVNDNENDKEIKGTKKSFVPPTPENVSGYCREKGYSIDVDRFIDFYTSKGWMIGKNKMKDWKAAVRNWARQDKSAPPGIPARKNSFNDFPKTDYGDMAELEKELTGN